VKNLLKLSRGYALSYFLFATSTAFGCDQVPPGQSLWIRLSSPISTYTAKVGDPVNAVLTEDLVCDDRIVLPMGAQMVGVVRGNRKVGWGIRHETASLELEFNRADAAPGVVVKLTARVEEVKNAREQVRKGVIQGIRSSDTFQGSINSRLIHLPTWNPYSDPVLIAYKAFFPIFPEPEIFYPAGTDIRLRTTTEISPPPVVECAVHDSTVPSTSEADQFEQVVHQLPWRTTTKKHVDADIVNIVFLGTERQVNAAFHVASWDNAALHTKRAWFKNLYALLNNSGYRQQPMMTLFLDGNPEDMNWQKSLNSYGRRDHLRVWRWTSQQTSDPIWVTSSTRDTSAVLSVKYKGFVHHIAPNIDDERSTVIRDLKFAGCVKSVSEVARPGLTNVTHNATGDVMYTDGSVAVVALQDCHPIDGQLTLNRKSENFKPGNYVFRYIRRQILTFRNDTMRANIIYGAYDVTRMTWTAWRHTRWKTGDSLQPSSPAYVAEVVSGDENSPASLCHPSGSGCMVGNLEIPHR
jgi:hypothetical protein